MSSNIRVEKICQYCGNKFIAKTSVTQYCSDKCSKGGYKKRKKEEKLRFAPQEQNLSKLYGPDKIRLGINKSPVSNLKELIATRQFFSLSQTSTLLGVSERTLFRMINRGQVSTIKIGGRTLIKKSELLNYFI